MQSSRFKSYLLVVVQFACLIGILLTGPWIARNPLLLALEMAGGLLGVWAIVTMRLGNLNLAPDVKPDARLVRSGPYRWIRHPMYAAVLLAALALVLDAPSALRWGLWLALLADLLVKLHYEERLLSAHFAGYAAYRQASKRLIPYLY